MTQISPPPSSDLKKSGRSLERRPPTTEIEKPAGKERKRKAGSPGATKVKYALFVAYRLNLNLKKALKNWYIKYKKRNGKEEGRGEKGEGRRNLVTFFHNFCFRGTKEKVPVKKKKKLATKEKSGKTKKLKMTAAAKTPPPPPIISADLGFSSPLGRGISPFRTHSPVLSRLSPPRPRYSPPRLSIPEYSPSRRKNYFYIFSSVLRIRFTLVSRTN